MHFAMYLQVIANILRDFFKRTMLYLIIIDNSLSGNKYKQCAAHGFGHALAETKRPND